MIEHKLHWALNLGLNLSRWESPAKLQRRIVGMDIAEANRGLGIASSAPEDAAPFIAASNALYKAVLARRPQ